MVSDYVKTQYRTNASEIAHFVRIVCSGLKTDHRSLSPSVDQSGEQWSAEPVGSGSPICQHVSNDVDQSMTNRSQNVSRKTGKFSGNRAKAFRKRSVVLTRVEIRPLEVIRVHFFQN